MAARMAAYAQSGESQTATLDALSKRLSDDLRQHIKSLGSFPLLGPEWVTITDSLKHISDIAMMEQKMPKQAGQDSMTLWDKDDMAVRMVLEEGKLNMCLRVLQEYKTLVRPMGAQSRAAEVSCAALGITPADLSGKMNQFEEALGLLMLCCLRSVEAGAPVRVGAGGALGLMGTQEALCVRYLAAIGAYGDDFDEDRLATLLAERGVLGNLLLVLARDGEAYGAEYRLAAAKFLAFLCDTEHYQTHVGAFFADDEAKQAFVALQESLVAPILAEGAAERRQLRPLMDAILTVKRQL